MWRMVSPGYAALTMIAERANSSSHVRLVAGIAPIENHESPSARMHQSYSAWLGTSPGAPARAFSNEMTCALRRPISRTTSRAAGPRARCAVLISVPTGRACLFAIGFPIGTFRGVRFLAARLTEARFARCLLFTDVRAVRPGSRVFFLVFLGRAIAISIMREDALMSNTVGTCRSKVNPADDLGLRATSETFAPAKAAPLRCHARCSDEHSQRNAGNVASSLYVAAILDGNPNGRSWSLVVELRTRVHPSCRIYTTTVWFAARDFDD